MKKALLGCTTLAGVALAVSAVSAAEAPTWKLTGNANFQVRFYMGTSNTKI